MKPRKITERFAGRSVKERAAGADALHVIVDRSYAQSGQSTFTVYAL